jgi:uncharacterized protein Yka (UPF0111/DUF47 family)
MAFWKKQKKIETLVLEHLHCVDESLVFFQEAFTAYLDGDMEKADRLALETHRAEGLADDVRRKVETALLGGALLAPSRRDILEIIEEVDKLANAGEAILDYLLLQQVGIPETKAIEMKEGEVDQLERAVIKRLFAMDLGLAEKLQVRGLVEELVEPSDRAEDLSDRVDMMIAQRRF